MSAKQTFAFCIDCWCIEYGIPDANGVYSRDSGSSNHWDHAVHVFGRPDAYPPPIRAVLTSLQAGAPITDGRMEMFSLALAVQGVQPNNGIKPDGPRAREAEGYVSGVGTSPRKRGAAPAGSQLQPALDLFGEASS